jgi:hydrogenase maturation protease
MIVIGLGNEFRHDDAAGLIAARRLREHGIPAQEKEGDLTPLIEKWQHADGVIFIDAIVSGAKPGTIHRLDLSTAPLAGDFFKGSTHTLGLPDVIELSRALGTLPCRVLLFGLEVRDTTPGIGLSREVEDAVPALIRQVISYAE